MLRVEKTTLGTFGEPELAGLINSRGWKSVLPDALDDQHLLLVSEQLRDLLAGKGWDDTRGPGSAALPISLLLLSEAGADRLSKGFDVAMCWRRFKIEPPCRLNFEPGLMANL